MSNVIAMDETPIWLNMQSSTAVNEAGASSAPLCTGQFQNRPSPPRTNPGAFDFLEKFWSNSSLCCQLDGQMPHPLELQRGSNSPPSRQVKAAVETSSAKVSATTNFLFSLSSLHTLNIGIFHDITI